MLDTDEDVATGYPDVDGSQNDASLIGADFIVRAGSYFFHEDEVAISRGNDNGVVGPLLATVDGALVMGTDVMDITIPLSELGDDDGVMSFTIDVVRETSPSTTTIITDYMPNLGLPVGSLR